jgi:hypothetical protein
MERVIRIYIRETTRQMKVRVEWREAHVLGDGRDALTDDDSIDSTKIHVLVF